MSEIKALMRFYERRGWCWLGAVEYLCAKNSRLPQRDRK